MKSYWLRCLVRDDYDVAPFGECWMAVTFLLREELVNGGEDEATGLHRQEFAQMRS